MRGTIRKTGRGNVRGGMPSGRGIWSGPLLGAVIAAAAGISLGMSGCIAGGHNHVEQSGRAISNETLSCIEPGHTKKDWVVATLGEPTSKTKLSDGSDVWNWTYCRRVDKSGYVLFVFGGHDKTSEQSTTYVQFKDDVVTKVWKDGDAK